MQVYHLMHARVACGYCHDGIMIHDLIVDEYQCGKCTVTTPFPLLLSFIPANDYISRLYYWDYMLLHLVNVVAPINFKLNLQLAHEWLTQ